MHQAKGDANDGDAEQEAVEEMGETNDDAAYDEPQHIHEDAQTAGLRWHPFHVFAEGPDGEYAELYALQAEGDADDGDHQKHAGDEILQGYVKTAKYEPDDVT